MEERLARMEEMIGQLVGMVAKTSSLQLEMQRDMREMQSDMKEMQSDLKVMRADFETEKQKNADRHDEIVGRLKSMEIDQDYIWEKTARNEREIEVLKRRLNLI
jgi:hypothetical protein